VATRTFQVPLSSDLMTVSALFGTAATATAPARNKVCGSGGAAARDHEARGVVVADVAARLPL
jgi:hypothetical protein